MAELADLQVAVAALVFIFGLAAVIAVYSTTKYFSLATRHQVVLEENELLREQATTDALTGLPNRRAFDRVYARMISYLRRESDGARSSDQQGERWVSLLIMDIDHFKAVNDQYGHNVGDQVLVGVAHVVRTELQRSQDFVCRWGGEEFVVLLADQNVHQAHMVAEKIRVAVSQAVFSEQNIHATVSVGVVSTDQQYDAEYLSIVADNALYQAKKQGRNQVVVSE